jgi:hypothetical protein
VGRLASAVAELVLAKGDHTLQLSVWQAEYDNLLYDTGNKSHNTPNYWGSGLCPSSGILKTRKHNVSETLSEGANTVGIVLPSPEDGSRSSFRNVMSSSS